MNTTKFICILFLGLFIFEASAAMGKNIVLVEYFYQPGCKECEMISAFVLPRMKERFKKQYELKKYDIGVKDNFLRLVNYQEKFKVDDNEPVCMVVNRTHAFAGYEKIESGIFDKIAECIAVKDVGATEETSQKINDSELLTRRAGKFTLLAIIGAGLVDGINPCVFSTLVFFVSLLSVSNVRGHKLLLVGIAYCAACFFTYLALGFGLFRFLKLFSGYSLLQHIINIGMAVVLCVFAALSFRDAWRFKKTGKASAVTLQLPRAVKEKIHKIMKKGLAYKYLVPGAFVVGILVTAFESVCTGQVYVPTLVLLANDSGTFSKWFLYLLLYNVMFIIPLLVVFASAYAGMSTPKLLTWSKKNVIYSKTLLGVFFILLAFLIVFIA